MLRSHAPFFTIHPSGPLGPLPLPCLASVWVRCGASLSTHTPCLPGTTPTLNRSPLRGGGPGERARTWSSMHRTFTSTAFFGFSRLATQNLSHAHSPQHCAWWRPGGGRVVIVPFCFPADSACPRQRARLAPHPKSTGDPKASMGTLHPVTGGLLEVRRRVLSDENTIAQSCCVFGKLSCPAIRIHSQTRLCAVLH